MLGFTQVVFGGAWIGGGDVVVVGTAIPLMAVGVHIGLDSREISLDQLVGGLHGQGVFLEELAQLLRGRVKGGTDLAFHLHKDGREHSLVTIIAQEPALELVSLLLGRELVTVGIPGGDGRVSGTVGERAEEVEE